MAAFNIIRLAVFGVTLAFALIILGISANFVAQTSHYQVYTASSVPGFGVATACLTFAILIPAIVIDMLRKGAMTSLVATELGFTGFLWVLWLACAANSTAALFGISLGDCSLYNSVSASYCSQYEAFQAFSWLNWLILFFYWATLLILALVAQSRGNNRAFMVPTTELTIPRGGHAGGEPKIPPVQNYPPGSVSPGTYPPQGYPQQSYTPTQYPHQGYTPSPVPTQGQMYQAPYTTSPPPPPANTIPV